MASAMSWSMPPRALHWVFKVLCLKAAMKLLEALGAKALRHEEFESGCEATCNGPYAGRWSKTMAGFGEEDDHFVFELTYNYGVTQYERGNDWREVLLHRVDQSGVDLVERAKAAGYTLTSGEDGSEAIEHAGMAFRFLPVPATRHCPVFGMALNVRSVADSVAFWQGVLGMAPRPLPAGVTAGAALGFVLTEPGLVLYEITEPIRRGEAFGRIAFSCAEDDVLKVSEMVKERSGPNAVLHPPVTLPTPGKADVVVTILADPEGQEICFVGDRGFRDLSRFVESAAAIDWAMRDQLDEAQKRYEARVAAKEAKA